MAVRADQRPPRGAFLVVAILLVACSASNRPLSSFGATRPPFSNPSLEAPPQPPPSVDVLPPTEDPDATLEPLPDQHADPSLDRLIDIELAGLRFSTASLSGEAAAAAGGYLVPLIDGLGRSNADLSTALAEDPSHSVDVLVFALKIRGVAEADLLNAFLAATSSQSAELVQVGGREVRRVVFGQTSYVFAKDGAVIVVQTSDPALAEEAIRAIG